MQDFNLDAKCFSLTSYQFDIWLKHNLNPGKPLCNIGAAVKLVGDISCDKMNNAINYAIIKNNALRIKIIECDNKPVQYYRDELKFNLPYYDFSKKSHKDKYVKDWIQNRFLIPFDLEDVLFDFALLKINENNYYLFTKAHHVILDGWSLTQLNHRIFGEYNNNPEYNLINDFSFTELVQSDNDYLKSDRYQRDLEFWKKELEELPEPMFGIKKSDAELNERFSFFIERNVFDDIKKLCDKNGFSDFHFFLAVITSYYYKILNKKEIIVSIPVLNRTKKERLILGHCANTIPIRISICETESFIELVGKIKLKLAQSYRHHKLSLGVINRNIQLADRDLSELLVSYEVHDLVGSHVFLESSYALSNQHNQNPLSVTINTATSNKDVIIYLDYLIESFKKESAYQLQSFIQRFLKEALINPDIIINDIDVVSLEEKRLVLEEWNDTKIDYPKDKCIHELFEEQVERAPENLALVYDDTKLSYRELNERSNQLAHYLQKKGVKSETLVGICVERSVEMMIGILGIIKAGGAYVPIDPHYPAERISYMIEDSGCSVLLTQESVKEHIPSGHPGEIISLDNEIVKLVLNKELTTNLKSNVCSSNLVYVIYTSGSTGKPKGTLIEHRSLINRLHWMQEAYPINATDTILQKTTYTFDVSVWEIFWWGIQGAKVCLLRPGEEKDPQAIINSIKHNDVTTIHFVPSMYATFLDYIQTTKSVESLSSLKQIFTSGEALMLNHVQESSEIIDKNRTSLINLYGPTEATIDVSYYNCSVSDVIIPIGKPINNTQLYITDKNNSLLPIGVSGELCIAGDGLARGYLNKEKLTKEKFVKNPFSSEPESRMYKTGDLARYLPDGNIEYLGRMDNQVKIRGFRIELGEIEAALINQKNISNCVVLAKEDKSGNKRLVAYIVVFEKDLESNIEDIKRALTQILPDYMVPALFVKLDEMPLTPNGKVDRKKLPEPEGNIEIKHEYVAPTTEVEKKLAVIWQNVLGIEKVGVYDNFFELGGHSLLAIELISEVKKELKKEIKLTNLFANPTVKYLSSDIENVTHGIRNLPELITDIENRYTPFPLTDVQQAYWIGRSSLFELGGVGTHSYVEVFLPELEINWLNDTLNYLIDRHDVLRMVVTEDGQQKILEKVSSFQVKVHDLRNVSPEEEEEDYFYGLRDKLSHQFFSGQEWPLFDFHVTVFRDSTCKLHYSMDALVLDATSARKFLDEITKLYFNKDEEFTKPPVSFRDYVITEQSLRSSELYLTSKKYWINRINSIPAAPELPLAKLPSEIKNVKFTQLKTILNKDKWQGLKDKITSIGVTPTVFLTQCFSEIIRQWSKSDQFTINLTLFNRIPFNQGVNDILGDFTSLTLLEMDFRAGSNFIERLKKTQYQLWEDIEHRYFSGIEVLREFSKAKGETVAMPIVITSILGADSSDNSLLTIFEERERNIQKNFVISQTPQVWIDCQLSDFAGELNISWDLVDELFPKGMIKDMFKAFENLLLTLTDEKTCWNEGLFKLMPQYQFELIAKTNQTEKKYPRKLLHELFTEQAILNNEKIAVKTSKYSMSYGKLLQMSRRLGELLKDMGALPNTHIAILMNKGWEQVVAVLGIHFSGAAYLPIDASLPDSRIKKLLEIAEVELLVSTGSVCKEIQLKNDDKWLLIDELDWDYEYKDSPVYIQSDKDIAYTIFTSGSTGEPKGVVIDHKGAVNTILDVNCRFGIAENDACLAISSLSFDLSVYDIFGLLAAGGTIIIPEPSEQKEPSAWISYIEREKVTVWNSVPALFQMLVESIPNEKKSLFLDKVLLSGDWIPINLPDKIKALNSKAEIYSLGGATEASIWSIFYPIKSVNRKWKSIPYGKPLANQGFHVLKQDLSLSPIWVPGDLYISGKGLALEYWKDDKKTNESFFVSPDTGERLYKTGDLGRYLPDGNIEFLGREDSQVKLQGHRIELGEIESALEQIEQIDSAVVDIRNVGNNSKKLVAYIVPQTNAGEESVGGLADAKNTIIDKNQRALFKLEQRGVRKVDAIPILLVNSQQSSIILRGDNANYEFTNRKITLEQFSSIFQCLRSKEVEELPLPKYFYPSAGSLYPVQTYVYIPRGSVVGINEGCYFYNPKHNSLHIVSTINPIISHNSKKLTVSHHVNLFLVSDRDAIEPLYGKYSDDFCCLEAGYMFQLLHKSIPEGLGVLKINTQGDDHSSCFALSNRHQLQQVLSIGTAITSKNTDLLSEKALKNTRETNRCVNILEIKPDHTLQLTYEERKSYREFMQEPVSFTEFSAIISVLKELSVNQFIESRNLEIYIHVKQHGVDKIESGIYLLDIPKMNLNRQTSNDNLIDVFAGSESIYEKSGFSIIIVSEKSKGLTRQKRQHAVGYIGQLLMNVSTKNHIGLCAIGIVNQHSFADIARTNTDYEVLHSFLGGRVSHEQIEMLSIPQEKGLTKQEELQKRLELALPVYMIPTIFEIIEKVPLTTNGKVNRKALPNPKIKVMTSKAEYCVPETTMEKKLAEIWQEVLGVEKVGVYDNFFELGGNSLLVVQANSKIKDRINIDLPLRTLFEFAVLIKLAEQIEENNYKEITDRIPVVSRNNKIPLSFSQERLWFINQYGDNASYNTPFTLRVKGDLCIKTLEKTLLEIIRRHEVLRTNFKLIDEEPCQIIHDQHKFKLEIIENNKESIIKQIKDEVKKPFDLASESLIRVHLHRIGIEESVLFINQHHIISDGWSTSIFIKEFSILYESYKKNKPSLLPELPIQYADYSVWQREHLQAESYQKQANYWKQKLSNSPLLELSTDMPRPKEQTHNGSRFNFEIDQTTTKGLISLGKDNESTQYITLLTLVKVLLSKHSGQTDISVGSPIANRSRSELEGLLGIFVNTIVMRSELDDTIPFKELLSRERLNTLEAYEHQDLSFEKIVELTSPDRDLSHSPLFQVMMVLQNTPKSELKFSGLDISPVLMESNISKFDLTFEFTETPEGLSCSIEYNTDLFYSDTIERMASHFSLLIEQVVETPDILVKDLEMVTKAERRQIIEKWNDTKVDYPEESCIHQLFERQTTLVPSKIAIKCGNIAMSYQELNEKANCLAVKIQKSITPNCKFIPILMNKCLEYPVTVMAILKLGLAFAPLDIKWPVSRISQLILEMKSNILLVNDYGQKKVNQDELLKGIVLNIDHNELYEKVENLNIEVDLKSPMFVVHTSGTTGIPKGAINHQGGILNRFLYMNKRYGIQENDVILMTSNIAFDAAVWQVLWPMINGKTVVIPQQDEHLNLEDIIHLIEKENITITDFVPSVFNALVENLNNLEFQYARFKTLRQLLIGGEEMNAKYIYDFKERFPHVGITNTYGPCETSIGTVFFEIPDEFLEKIPIGKPIDNVLCLVLDQNLNLVPNGVSGELFLGGICTGLGYLNNKEQTEKSFIRLNIPEYNDCVFYKTGDLVKYQSDGNLLYLGRSDDQLKIMGVRVELNEIERKTLEIEGVNQVALKAIGNNGSTMLVAYYVASEELVENHLREQLMLTLPKVMIPKIFVAMETLPLTSNGKINKKELPDPEDKVNNNDEYIAPENEIEKRLAKIWEEVLDIKRVGVYDNFFEIGGHSLLATQLVSRIRKEFNIELPLKAMFEYTNIKMAAKYVDVLNRHNDKSEQNYESVNTENIYEV